MEFWWNNVFAGKSFREFLGRWAVKIRLTELATSGYKNVVSLASRLGQKQIFDRFQPWAQWQINHKYGIDSPTADNNQELQANTKQKEEKFQHFQIKIV